MVSWKFSAAWIALWNAAFKYLRIDFVCSSLLLLLIFMQSVLGALVVEVEGETLAVATTCLMAGAVLPWILWLIACITF